ncbi:MULTISPECIES: anthranilate synthase component I [Methylorubrum]|jgi:anthranilate synthase component I
MTEPGMTEPGSTTAAHEAAARAYEAGRASLLGLTLVADLETPVAAFLKLKAGQAGPGFLLESVEGGAVRGRYSMIGLDPDLIWRCRDGRPEIARDAGLSDFVPDDRAPLDSLRALIAESAVGDDAQSAALPPMAAGLFGYLGYDMVRAMERLPEPNPDPLGVPDAILIRPRVMVVFDAVADALTVVTPVRPAEGVSARAALEAAQTRLDRVAEALEGPLPIEARADAASLALPSPVSNTEPEAFLGMVAKAKEYIVAGDIFQVVLSQRFEAPFTLPAFALYRSLRRTNPAPFLCYLDFEAFQVVCSSPEILVRVRDDKVTIRPIAGTRRRGATPAEDRALADELLADPKERSEHLMLLDLGRNDVGRVSKIGSVTVTDSFFLEYYSQVMHIVSNVEGDLDPRHDALSALAAGFPAGTVSGAPKVRAMEIIDELEREKRGPYGGCIGYFGARGEMDTCIVLRTAIVKDGRMHVQAGAGIVYDSDPASEQQECVNKAKALFRAAEDAVQFASRAKRGQ